MRAFLFLLACASLRARCAETDMLMDAKHRVRSTRGARGSNPSQKTPRQRSVRKHAVLRTREPKACECVASFRLQARCEATRNGIATRHSDFVMRACLFLFLLACASLRARCAETDMLMDAKHRVRSTRGARGSNPSQKTPRQRSVRKHAVLRTREPKACECVASFRLQARCEATRNNLATRYSDSVMQDVSVSACLRSLTDALPSPQNALLSSPTAKPKAICPAPA